MLMGGIFDWASNLQSVITIVEVVSSLLNSAEDPMFTAILMIVARVDESCLEVSPMCDISGRWSRAGVYPVLPYLYRRWGNFFKNASNLRDGERRDEFQGASPLLLFKYFQELIAH
jgi:hypothetical protein